MTGKETGNVTLVEIASQEAKREVVPVWKEWAPNKRSLLLLLACPRTQLNGIKI